MNRIIAVPIHERGLVCADRQVDMYTIFIPRYWNMTDSAAAYIYAELDKRLIV